MPMIPLRAEELLMLSTFCVKEVGPVSPMRRLYARSPELLAPQGAEPLLNALVQRRMLHPGKDGKPRLDPNLEPVLWMLNRPDQVFSLARLGAPDIAESYFCSSGSLWVQESVNFDEKLELLCYPFNWEAIATWFADDFLKDLAPKGGGKARTLRLLVPELLLLLAMQSEYGARVQAKKGPLQPKDLWLDLGHFGKEETIQEHLKVASIYLPPERFRAYFGDRALLGKVAVGLAKRGVVEHSGGALRFAEDGRRWFNPGRRQALITAKSFTGGVLKAKTLYAYPEGWVLFELPDPENLELRLRWIPGGVSKRRVFERLMAALVTPVPQAKNPPRPKPPSRAKAAPAAAVAPVPPPPVAPPPVPPASPSPATVAMPAATPEPAVESAPPTMVMRAPELPPLRLCIEAGPGVGRTLNLPVTAMLGRLEGTPVRVDDPRVSRRHAEFRRAVDGTWTLTDLGSANGTFLNDKKLEGTAALKVGDRIRVAETVFRVEG